MSNLPSQSAAIHNDDNDEQTNSSNNILSTINSRITSPLIIKLQQNTETEIANNQAYDEIHDLQPKHSLIKKTTNDNSHTKNSTKHLPTKSNNSHELMQGNYYDQNRYHNDYSSSTNYQSRPALIDINLEDYKKTIAPVSTSKNSSNKNRTNSPPFGDTSESIQQGIAQSAGILLELNKTPMKTNNKSHERAVIDYFPNNNDDENTKQRSVSSSSSSDCSTSDSSTSNKCQEDKNKSTIPYEKLSNDEDDDEELIEQTKKPSTESTTLLNKNLPQTYGTQSTKNLSYEHGKYLSNNGYNSHGSSITTKSSSDNSGSVRTNSGSDNDEESDEEHYNNSTASTTMPIYSRTNDSSIKSLNKSNDNRYLTEQINYQLGRSNINRSDQNDIDEKHRQINRIKHLPIDDPNSNNNKLTSGTDQNILPHTSNWPLQQSSNNQTNTLSSSSHQNLNLPEQQPSHSKLSRNNSRQHQARTIKKRKKSQQDVIRTELIPGHRGDRDVDELVMFIDGNSSKPSSQPQQNSTLSNPTDSNKPRLTSKTNFLDDPNSTKTSSGKKSRKSIKIVQQSISSTNNNENKTSDYSTPIEHNDVHSSNFINEHDQTTTHSIVDITNQSLQHRNVSTEDNESHLNTVDVNSTKTTNGGHSLPDWFEQTRNTSLQTDDIDSYCLSPSITNNLNSEIISEPFVTVTHRRRPVKERRQDNYSSSRSARFPPPSSSSSTTNDKRRIPSTAQNGIIRPTTTRNILSNTKPIKSPVIKEEKTNSRPSESTRSPSSPSVEPSSTTVNPINEQILEKQQSSPRLSSHSSSSSLSSLLKRTPKPPPVVFLNKSIDIELNDVSFGFDLDSTTLSKSPDDINAKLATTESDIDMTNTSIHPSNEPVQPNEISTDYTTQKFPRRFQQRNNRGPQFYSGSDIRPHHHRNYPSQSIPQSSYIDPLFLLQYNQRFANYPQQFAYMNVLRTPYISPQSQYVFTPTAYPTTTATTTNETETDDDTNQTSSDQIQEPLYVYTAPTGQLYFHPSTTKKPFTDSEQQQQQTAAMPTVYTTTPTIYPSHYFYPSQAPHLIPSHPAYFQPISSPSLLIETKSEQNNTDDVDIDDNYENPNKLYQQTRQQSSADIMSNALQLVYSQQRRNAQTDRFNLDDLTAYLAMKWTDSVDHYEQGDNRILLVDEQ